MHKDEIEALERQSEEICRQFEDLSNGQRLMTDRWGKAECQDQIEEIERQLKELNHRHDALMSKQRVMIKKRVEAEHPNQIGDIVTVGENVNSKHVGKKIKVDRRYVVRDSQGWHWVAEGAVLRKDGSVGEKIGRHVQDVVNGQKAMPPGLVPENVVFLTAGIDVQDNGFRYVILGWETDVLYHLIAHGQLSTLTDVEALIFQRRYPKPGGETLGISRAAMDTGAGLTEEVYEWLKIYGRGIVFGVKGSSRHQTKRIFLHIIEKKADDDRMPPDCLELRMLDIDVFKEQIHRRLKRKESLLYGQLGADWAQHYLDCEVYAVACADNQWTPNLWPHRKKA